jgi:hypothetical protein
VGAYLGRGCLVGVEEYGRSGQDVASLAGFHVHHTRFKGGHGEDAPMERFGFLVSGFEGVESAQRGPAGAGRMVRDKTIKKRRALSLRIHCRTSMATFSTFLFFYNNIKKDACLMNQHY